MQKMDWERIRLFRSLALKCRAGQVSQPSTLEPSSNGPLRHPSPSRYKEPPALPSTPAADIRSESGRRSEKGLGTVRDFDSSAVFRSSFPPFDRRRGRDRSADSDGWNGIEILHGLPEWIRESSRTSLTMRWIPKKIRKE